MTRTINYSERAFKSLAKMPNNASRLIRTKIENVAAGIATNNISRMIGSDTERLRVGDYRVVFYMTDTTMEVVKIGPRGSVYDD